MGNIAEKGETQNGGQEVSRSEKGATQVKKGSSLWKRIKGGRE